MSCIGAGGRNADVPGSWFERYMSVSIHFIDLADRYAVDGCLLGRSFSFHYGDADITVILPSVIRKNGFLELGIPSLMDYCGDLRR